MALTLSSVDDSARTQPKLPPSFPHSCLPPSLESSSLRQQRAPCTTPTLIPTYLLSSPRGPPVTQRRYSSTIRRVVPFDTRSYRVYASQGTHRHIKSPSLTPEQAQCIATAMSLGLELTTESTFPQPTLSHLTASGTAHMISIASKPPTYRTATAVCTVFFSNPSAYAALSTATLRKGDAIAVARIAGIMAAKKTADLIPLAHPGIGVTGVDVEVELFEGSNTSRSSRSRSRSVDTDDATPTNEAGPDVSTEASNAAPAHARISDPTHSRLPRSRFGGVAIRATVECEGKTGVEMEALTAAAVAGLTVYDMCKGIDKGIVMQGVRVLKKTGGKSGGWVWDERTGEGRLVVPEGTAAAKTPALKTPALATQPHQDRKETQGDLGSEYPLEQFYKLVAMDGKEFAAEMHRMRCAWHVVWEAKKERERIGLEHEERTRAEAEAEEMRAQEATQQARVREHVSRCKEEVQSGERGRVEQSRLERARTERRRWFERGSEGTVLVPESRSWTMTPA